MEKNDANKKWYLLPRKHLMFRESQTCVGETHKRGRGGGGGENAKVANEMRRRELHKNPNGIAEWHRLATKESTPFYTIII